MISIYLGNVGGGKTVSAMYRMVTDRSGRMFYTNIITHKSVKNNTTITPEMIYKKIPITKPDGTPILRLGQPVYKYEVNKDFWQEAVKRHGGINIILDELHMILNARVRDARSKAVLDWLALIRRVLGGSDGGGEFIGISQLERRLDVVLKEQSNLIVYNSMRFNKTCSCGFFVPEDNEIPEKIYRCPECGKGLKETDHVLETWSFSSYDSFLAWKYGGKKKGYFKHQLHYQIKDYFKLYDTLQWENLLC